MLDLEERNRLIVDNADLCGLVARLTLGKMTTLRRREMRDELEGECRLLLVNAARRFDPAQYPGVPFKLFAKQFMLWRVIECIRRRPWRDSSHAQLERWPPSEMSSRFSDNGSQAEAIGNEELGGRLDAALAKLSDKQYALLAARIIGDRKIREVGAELGLRLPEAKAEIMKALTLLASDPALREMVKPRRAAVVAA